MQDFVIKKKAKTHKGRKYLKSREPKRVEGPKQTLLLRGNKTSNINSLKKTTSRLFTKKHKIKAFQDPSSLEFLCERNAAALFVLVSNSKKRPNNMLIGRTFDKTILDMAEFEVQNYKSMKELKCGLDINPGARPVVTFQGDVFESNSDYERIKNLLQDFWVSNITFTGIDVFQEISYQIVYTCQKEGIIEQRVYRIHTKEGSFTLEEMGPSASLKVLRLKLAAPAVYKQACKQPRIYRKKHLKNVSRNALGEQEGRVYVQQQPLKTIYLKKRKPRKVIDPTDEGEQE